MRRLVAIGVAVLALAGCSAAPVGEPTGVVPLVSSDTTVTEETAVPEPEFTEAELEFLEWMKSETVAPNVEGKSAEELVAAAWAACDLFAQGVNERSMELIEGGYENNADLDIASLASQFLCTEYDITVIK